MIKFCHADDPVYGWLSNMYLAEVEINGTTWPSVEHYYQAQKFNNNPQIQSLINTAHSAEATRELAQKYKAKRRKDWNEVKEDMLYFSMKEKFTKNKEMRKKLRNTGDTYLQKSVPDDPFWGVLPNGEGQNRMGEMIMEIRKQIV